MVRSDKVEPRVSATYVRSLVKQQLASSTIAMTTTTDGTGKTQTHKKQVRRRLHTSRPYQERLLNMAEARREIVTALKQHRASVRHATRAPPPPPPPENLFSPPLPPPPDPFSWTNLPLGFVLPNQPLGLNLNFHDFNDFIQTSSTCSSSSSSTSSSSSSICPTNQHIYSSPSPPPTFVVTSDFAPQSQYSTDKQQHQLMMDTENNVVTSAMWSELMMKTVEPEIKPAEEVVVVEDDVFPKLNDVMEFPSWLNQTEEELLHPYNLTRYSSLHNPPLSCMEIEEIEGMDGDDWLA